ncbi:hypothetical protein ASF10_20085 [Flavobacterium sp. Leaf82]|uniref:hypothetical protein n=1 Tax=unclassified Flavobacterium TaxID=196869 RepID=UPI0006FBC42B|nr:hypothetical protein [Flavobacterium sp. Leaf82]KQO32759.1 hypothetical protein ASF10_20085 [Flavobacterium sp. Leaf82]
MRIATIFFCLFFNMVIAQNNTSDFIQKKIESCRIPINDSTSVYHIHENMYNNEINFYLKTENVITSECNKKSITKKLTDRLNFSQNPIIEINNYDVKNIVIKDFTNVIPTKIIASKKLNYTSIIIEINSFSYSTIGNGYIYVCLKVDKKGKVIKKKIFESKLPLKTNRYKKIF